MKVKINLEMFILKKSPRSKSDFLAKLLAWEEIMISLAHETFYVQVFLLFQAFKYELLVR